MGVVDVARRRDILHIAVLQFAEAVVDRGGDDVPVAAPRPAVVDAGTPGEPELSCCNRGRRRRPASATVEPGIGGDAVKIARGGDAGVVAAVIGVPKASR